MRLQYKLNRQEKRAVNEQKIKNALHGEGLFEFQNNTKGVLTLPKFAEGGVKYVAPGKNFTGDSYFLQMVRSNDLRLIREINLNTEGGNMEDKKLILDQPKTVTSKGQVEHVTSQPETELHEGSEEQKDVLINEDPIEGLEIYND